MLNMAKAELKLISNSDMYLFCEKGLKSIVCYISKRYSKANNKYLKTRDQKQESIYIVYLDSILNGHGVSTFYPTSGFKWIDPKNFNSNKYSRNSSKKCF